MTSQTQQLEELQVDKRTQPLFIDFYNLHLRSGPDYDRGNVPIDLFDVTSLIPEPREFEAPYERLEILGRTTVSRIYPDPDEEKSITDFIGKHFPELENGFGLEWYREQVGNSWFESSKHFMRFADDYHYTKRIVDEYMDGKITVQSYKWLNLKLDSHTYLLVLKLVSEDGEELRMWPMPDQDPTSKLDTRSYRPDISWYMLDQSDRQQLPYYGIRCSQLQYQIAIELIQMLQQQWSISQCHYHSCSNVFILGSGRYQKRYCSDSHRVMAFRRRQEAKK